MGNNINHWLGHLRLGCGLVAALSACAPHPKQAPPELAVGPTGEVRLSQQEQQQSRIRLAPVDKVEIGGRVVTSGRVTYNDLLVSHITSPVSGRLTEIIGQFGQAVRKGAPLAVIVSPDMGIASSDMDKAQADLNQASLDLTRQKSLVAAHAAPERDFENAEDTFDRAKSEFERARKKMRLFSLDPNAEVNQNYVLRSAIDGEIISRTAFIGAEIQGQYAGGNTNDLFLVADLKEVWVIGDIHEADMGRVKAGQRVDLVVEGVPNQIFEGQVDLVSDILDAGTRTARVRCVVQNPNGQLKPDMFASVTIAAPGHSVLAIPRSAVVKMGDKTVVFVGENTTDPHVVHFVRRPVIVDDDPRESFLPVTHGLNLGEQVVVEGASVLSKRF
jgi:cobalt-zinc-cadmium efflux system membrane fusion protein